MAKRREYSAYSSSDFANDVSKMQLTTPQSSYKPDKSFATSTSNAVVPSLQMAVEPERPQLFDVKVLERNVANCLQIIDDEVMRSYVTKLSDLPIITPCFDEKNMEREPYQWFHITKLVYEQDEFSVSKLATVFQAVSGKNSTLVLMIQNQNHRASFYLGVRNHDEKDFTGTLRQMLEMSLKGQFPGSDFDNTFDIKSMESIKQQLDKNTKAVSSVTCIPDFKQYKDFYENKDFLQGLEKFVASMQEKDYTAVVIADAVPYDDLYAYRTELESVCTQLSPFESMQYQINTSTGSSTANTKENGQTKTNTSGEITSTSLNSSFAKSNASGTTDTTGNSQTHGTSNSSTRTTSRGKTTTDGTNSSTSDGTTKTDTFTVGSTQTVGGSVTAGANAGAGASFAPGGVGGSVNAGVFGAASLNASLSFNESYSHSTAKSHTETKGESHSIGISDSVSNALMEGTNESFTNSNSHAINKSLTNTQTTGKSDQHGTNSSYSEAFSFGHAETITDTFGESKGITMHSKNMMIGNMLKKLQHEIERIDECESMGMWNCAVYFMSESKAISETAALIYHSLVSGERSGVERSSINTWYSSDKLPYIKKYLTHFCHPKFAHSLPSNPTTYFVSPAALISTKELAIQMSLPRKSVRGLPVAEHAVFGQEVVVNNKLDSVNTSRKFINLGKIYHLNSVIDTKVKLDLNSLAMHTFVAGSTGAGKSNTIYHIIDELSRKKIPYLVIEPAKGEYKTKFKNANIYGTNPNIGKLLKLNPFSFPKEIHVQEHIDKLVELFNVCWPMYAAMPAVLKDSIISAYESSGWDMMESVNAIDENLFPTFEDVLRELDSVVKEADYSKDTSSDYKGALKTRLKSLTNGINGMIFSNKEVSYSLLFDSETIVDLSRVGSMETKSLMMGVLVLKLQEYRIANHSGTDSELNHVTILEEAHNLLKKTSTEQNNETANIQGKSVEMLTNAIAEMRTYGEGFIIADQAPDLLDTAVIRNTNTKIVLRLPEGNDRKITGTSMALKDNQIQELSKLPTGVAVVYQNNWQEAVLCSIPKYVDYDLPKKAKQDKQYTSEKELLKKLLKDGKVSNEEVIFSDAPAMIRKKLLQNLKGGNKEQLEYAIAEFANNRIKFGNLFEGVSRVPDLKEVGDIVVMNIQNKLGGFSSYECKKLGYYICKDMLTKSTDSEATETLGNLVSFYFKKGCFK